MTRSLITLVCAAALVAGCDSSQEREATLTTSEQCLLEDAPHSIAVGASEDLAAFAQCVGGTRCQSHGPLLAESLIGLAIDVDAARVRSHDYSYSTTSSAIVSLNGNSSAVRDGCSGHPVSLQGIVTSQAGSAHLRLHTDGALDDDDARAVLRLAVARPDRIELLANDDDERSLQTLTIALGETPRVQARVLDEDGARITTLGAEYWWVDHPELVTLTPVLADPDATDGSPAPRLQTRGTQVDLHPSAPGTTQLHVLALNVEHTLELVIQP